MRLRLLLVSVLSLNVVFSLQAQTTNYHVYALFVVNIAKYSSWPSPDAELHIAVLGKTKVYEELMKQHGKQVNGHTLRVTQVEGVADIGNVDMLYLADGKSGLLDEVLKATQEKPVIVVGERDGLFKKGAGFSFVIMDNGTLRYDINQTELERRQIRVSKSLAALANSTL